MAAISSWSKLYIFDGIYSKYAVSETIDMIEVAPDTYTQPLDTQPHEEQKEIEAWQEKNLNN